jgi:hypothetical protein
VKLLPLTDLQASIVEIEIIDGADADEIVGHEYIVDHWNRSNGKSLAVPDAESLYSYLRDVADGYDAVAERWAVKIHAHAKNQQGFDDKVAARRAAKAAYALADKVARLKSVRALSGPRQRFPLASHIPDVPLYDREKSLRQALAAADTLATAHPQDWFDRTPGAPAGVPVGPQILAAVAAHVAEIVVWQYPEPPNGRAAAVTAVTASLWRSQPSTVGGVFAFANRTMRELTERKVCPVGVCELEAGHAGPHDPKW